MLKMACHLMMMMMSDLDLSVARQTHRTRQTGSELHCVHFEILVMIDVIDDQDGQDDQDDDSDKDDLGLFTETSCTLGVGENSTIFGSKTKLNPSNVVPLG